MKLHLLDRSSADHTSITVSHNVYDNFLKVWHFHEELELVYIIESTGTRFVGDHIEKFEEGEVVLIGKNVPHMWLNDDVYFKSRNKLRAEAIALHFKEGFVGENFLALPEMRQLSNLLIRASQGIKFLDVSKHIKADLKKLNSLQPALKVLKVLEILTLLSQSKNYALLSSSSFMQTFQQTENDRLNRIYEYVFQNFHTPIGAKDVAHLISMNPSAFSRFFKSTHRKPFTRFLNEIRIGFACKLLLEKSESITSIAYSCGFNNISNFNRQFKIIKGENPSSFLGRHTNNL